MADLNDLIDAEGPKLSRRNVVVGTAWAVPTIMAVGAAPAMAFSTGAPGTVGKNGKVITFTYTLTGYQTGDTVTLVSVFEENTTTAFNWKTAPVRTSATSGTSAVFTWVGEAQTGGGNPANWVATFAPVTHVGSGAVVTTVSFSY